MYALQQTTHEKLDGAYEVDCSARGTHGVCALLVGGDHRVDLTDTYLHDFSVSFETPAPSESRPPRVDPSAGGQSLVAVGRSADRVRLYHARASLPAGPLAEGYCEVDSAADGASADHRFAGWLDEDRMVVGSLTCGATGRAESGCTACTAVVERTDCTPAAEAVALTCERVEVVGSHGHGAPDGAPELVRLPSGRLVVLIALRPLDGTATGRIVVAEVDADGVGAAHTLLETEHPARFAVWGSTGPRRCLTGATSRVPGRRAPLVFVAPLRHAGPAAPGGGDSLPFVKVFF